jgi:hypothetical protein
MTLRTVLAVLHSCTDKPAAEASASQPSLPPSACSHACLPRASERACTRVCERERNSRERAGLRGGGRGGGHLIDQPSGGSTEAKVLSLFCMRAICVCKQLLSRFRQRGRGQN